VQPLWRAAQALPPGLAGLALAPTAGGPASTRLLLVVAVAGYGGLFAIVLRRRLIAQYRGEDAMESSTSGGARGVTASQALAEAAAGAPQFLRGTLAALIAKDLRYLRRNLPMMLQFVVPLFLIVMFTMMRSNRPRDTEFLQKAGDMFFSYSVAYALLIIAPMAHNVFAFEGRGFNFLLLAPVRFREVLMAKNIVFGCAMLAETLLILTVISVFAGPPGPIIIVATFAAVIFGAFVHVTLGNVLSIYYPRRFDFGQFKQRQSGLSVLFGLLTQIVLFGIVAVVFAAARWLGQMWLAVVALALLVAAAWQVYVVMLEHAGRIAEQRREQMTAELCKE
jgi:ABC-2 type transport system permease protein